MNNLDYKMYVIAELQYENNFLDIKRDVLYPYGWFSDHDYKAKSEIIAAAISEKKLIGQTEQYKSYVLSRQHRQ